MRRNHLGWLVLISGAALQAGACADTERNERNEGTAGTTTGGSKANGGSEATGGDVARGGASTQGGKPSQDPGGDAGRGAGGEPSGMAGAGGAFEPPACADAASTTILGNYREPNGDELWLRNSGKAVTLARVPAGVPVAAKLPALWQVVQTCPADSLLVLKGSAGRFKRVDYLPGANSLTLCFAVGSASSVAEARALPAADRANTIDGGCNGEPWLRVTKETN